MSEYRIDDLPTLRGQMERAYYHVRDLIRSGKRIEVVIREWSKSRDQEKKYHAMLRDFSRQIKFEYSVDEDNGKVVRLRGRNKKKTYSTEVWKALLVDKFAQEKKAMGEPLRHPGQTIISLDGMREITVRPSTKQFLMSEAGDFIEFLYAEGTEMGIRWSEPAMRAYNEFPEAQAARKAA